MQKQFNGKRLTEARELRTMTKIGLSEISNISRLSLMNYEKGEQTPRHDVVTKLSNFLNVPYEFFFTDDDEVKTQAVFFRSFSSATKSERSRSETKLKWLKEIYSWLNGYIIIPEFNLPDFGIDEKNYTALNDEQIEGIAYELRKLWGLEDSPITNLTSLLEEKGCIISMGESENNKIDAFSEWDFKNNYNPVIFSGDFSKSAVRTRFSLAHELGHLVLHRSIKKDRMNQKFHKLREEQVNYFAGAFLMPDKSFSESVVSPSIEQYILLKKYWKTSIAAMVKRSYNLGLINKQEQTNFYKYLSKKGWRYVEPLDDEIPRETPIYLRSCIELMLKHNAIKIEDIVRLGYPLPEFEKLLNLDENFIDERISKKAPHPKLKLLKFDN